ncbi:MAG: hypothetical protein EOO41_04225 [Methanobacteriota archaeon]|nr:MAG: hypothetical protein EOO41_04225 [Euryarchaeota archaeon]
MDAGHAQLTILRTARVLMDAWLSAKTTSGTKVVLLVHEVDQILQKLCASPQPVQSLPLLRQCLQLCLPLVCEAIQSDNNREAQLGLGVFKQEGVRSVLLEPSSVANLRMLLRTLYRDGRLHWNATVNKLVHTVAARLASENEDAVLAAWASMSSSPALGTHAHPHGASRADAPASSASGGAPRPNPPVTITGVAPWAQPAGAGLGVTTRHPGAGGGRLPAGTGMAGAPAAHFPMTGISHRSSAGADAALQPAHDAGASGQADAHASWSAWLERLVPPTGVAVGADSGGDVGTAPTGAKRAASATVLAREATLLPSLRFHDLVFGHDLGTGTFSVVKYAKRIAKGALPSTWAEYAVKIISTDIMRQLGYESSVQREMAVLSQLTHPNIVRLVAAFRYREGAFLVLEYAPSRYRNAATRRTMLGCVSCDSTAISRCAEDS